jgi:hypothetical protein
LYEEVEDVGGFVEDDLLDQLAEDAVDVVLLEVLLYLFV